MQSRILIVDDEQAILFNIKAYFGRLGFDVDCAQSLSQAKELLEQNRYILLIADLRLTGADESEGLELVAHAKHLPFVPQIIVLTAYGSAAMMEEAVRRGANAILQKPQPLSQVAQVAMALLSASRETSRLDRTENPVRPTSTAPEVAEEMTRKKILLVDDSATTLMMHEMILSKRTTYQIVIARDGQEAVDKAIAEQPDLILMDVVMPRLTGLEACQQLRSYQSTHAIPIILVTTRGEERSVENGYESGCNDYITKPVNPAELVELLDSYLGQ